MNIQFLLKRLCVWMKLTVLCLNISILAEDILDDLEDEDEQTCSFGESLCSLMCKTMGYKHSICNWDGCTCLQYQQKLGESERCQFTCEKYCVDKKNGDSGICDHKGNCFCYMERESIEIENKKCLLTNKFCRWKCWNIGLTDSNCVGGNCLCHNDGQNATLLDYKNGHCVLPREYCHSRCYNASFADGGHCHHSDCVCTSGESVYFLINLEDIETLCEACRHYCENERVAKGTCVNGDCLCLNGDWYEVATWPKSMGSFGFVKDHCMKICAERNYHTKAIPTGFASCSCEQDGSGLVPINLQDVEIKPIWRLMQN